MALKILGTGSYLPPQVVTNDDLAKSLETSDDWIFSHTGIHARHIAEEDDCTSTMATKAARAAMEAAGVAPEEIGLIIVATSSPDYNTFPSTACLVQAALGCPATGAYDLQAACAGFVYALDQARCWVKVNPSRKAIVIGSETLSRVVEKVKREVDRRRLLASPHEGGEGLEASLSQLGSNLLIVRDISLETSSRLERAGMLECFGFIAFMVDYPSSTLDKTWSLDDYHRLYEWQGDVIAKVMPSVFPQNLPVSPSAMNRCLFISFVHSFDGTMWKAMLSRLEAKVQRASAMVTSMRPTLVDGGLFHGAAQLGAARSSFEDALMARYLGSSSPSAQELDVASVYPRVEAAVKAKDIVSMKACIKLLSLTLASHDHRPSQAAFALSALQSALYSGLDAIGVLDASLLDDDFARAAYLSSRSQVVQLLDDVEDEATGLLQNILGNRTSPIVDKAREYVMEHVSERISLADVASWAGVSIGYMSKVFKRVMGMSLVDYVNKMKVERAKEMMTRGHVMVNEVALALGFENIYYFSKVFKRVCGLSPSEWQKRQEAD